MIWNCVEDRIDDGSKYGRVSRKIIFGNIYADKTAVLSRNPIPVDAHTHLKVHISEFKIFIQLELIFFNFRRATELHFMTTTKFGWQIFCVARSEKNWIRKI